MLENFFDDPNAFRSLQGRCNTLLIGGPFINFFARTEVLGRDKGKLVVILWRNYDRPIRDYIGEEGYKRV